MAAIAAISAVGALRFQQSELARARLREEEEDKRNSIADFERAFFQLLEHHRSIVNSIDIESSGASRTGQDGFRSIIYYFERRSQPGQIESWKQTFEKYKNDLGHYFRFLYHIIRFVDSKPNVDRYSYAQLIRATLSESETLALALNCVWGEGLEKFKPLVERYALLHNLSEQRIEKYKLRGLFEPAAFSFHPDSLDESQRADA